MKAVRLREVDRDYRIHQLAFLSHAVRAEKKAGKNKTRPVYSKFRKFYDYEAEIERAMHPEEKQTSRFAALSKHMREMEQYE